MPERQKTRKELDLSVLEGTFKGAGVSEIAFKMEVVSDTQEIWSLKDPKQHVENPGRITIDDVTYMIAALAKRGRLKEPLLFTGYNGGTAGVLFIVDKSEGHSRFHPVSQY